MKVIYYYINIKMTEGNDIFNKDQTETVKNNNADNTEKMAVNSSWL